ncbi:MAG: GAF domain-containing protein [Gemmatimonadaceae bacterium]|nr:GAF domain-containing protein [Gemmatimonadaceae bacterium]
MTAPVSGDAARLEGAVPPALTHLVQELASGVVTKRALFARLADTARDLTRAEGSAVIEMEGEEQFRIIAPSGSVSRFDGLAFPLMKDRSIFRDVVQSRQSQFTNDAPNDPRVNPAIAQPINVRQLVVAPISLNDDVVGLLAIINPETGEIRSEHVAWLEHLAAHGSLVIRSLQLVDAAERAAGEARWRAEDAARAAHANAILARGAQTFTTTESREGLLAALGDLLRTEFRSAGFAVYEANPVLRTVRLEYQIGAFMLDREDVIREFWQTQPGNAVVRGEPVFIDDVSPIPMIGEFSSTMDLRRVGVRAIALLPLRSDDRVRGLVSVRYAEPHHFDDDERQLLIDLVNQFALAHGNLGYVDALEERAQRLALLARSQQQLTQLSSEDALPNGIAEAVYQVLPSAVCELLVVQGNDLIRVVRLEKGQLVSTDLAPLADLTIARDTADTGVSRLATHLSAAADVVRGTTELCAAVRFGLRSAGVIRLFNTDDNPFEAQDLDLITILSRHAGTALETARLFTLQDLQRQRAEGAADLARATLSATSVAEGATELLHVLDRYVPSIGKAIGVARGRDGRVEFVAAGGTLDSLRSGDGATRLSMNHLAPDGQPVVFPSLRDAAPTELASDAPDDWALAIPLVARERTLGVLLVTTPQQAPLLRRDRITLERLSASLALALDALLLDEEERLAREREHLLATALTTINHPIFILDRVGVRYANPAAAREYGWSQAELMEMQFEQLVVGEDAREGHDTRSGVVEPGVRLTNDTHRRRDATEFPAAVTVSPLLGHDGDLLGQVVSVRNVSQDRRLEEQLRHTEKMVALGELVAGVAHEINNPLTGISAFAQLLLEEELSDDQRESIGLIKQESDRAKHVINDLLLFARKGERGTGPVDVNAILEHTVRLRAYPLRSGKVEVRLQLDDCQPQVRGDSQKLQQVLLNLIGNAEHAMHEREVRTLILGTRCEDEQVYITVRDSGRGMTPDVRRRIFEPFYSTKPAGVGTGLGLSVSYGIISAHGGTITVDSEPDVGTLVTITLPSLSKNAA